MCGEDSFFWLRRRRTARLLEKRWVNGSLYQSKLEHESFLPRGRLCKLDDARSSFCGI